MQNARSARETFPDLDRRQILVPLEIIRELSTYLRRNWHYNVRNSGDHSSAKNIKLHHIWNDKVKILQLIQFDTDRT